MSHPIHLVIVAGTRPNFIKIAPLMRTFEQADDFRISLVHTGQHYDDQMSKAFFADLGIRQPDANLEIGTGGINVQAAKIIERFDAFLEQEKPDGVIVVGDVTSTAAASWATAHRHIPLFHVEAGLRSFDREMPEELNRLVTDRLSDLLFVSEQSGVNHLRTEGVDDSRILFVGNVMIDTLLHFQQKAEARGYWQNLNLPDNGYGLVTLHRPSNVDDKETLRGLLDVLHSCSERLPLVWPMHPRTKARLEAFGWWDEVQNSERFHLLPPLGYLDFINLLMHCRIAMSDSGGLQEEATCLRKPTLTLRHNTERPSTCEFGGNQLVGTDPEKIYAAFRRVMDDPDFDCQVPPLWDGKTAQRIMQHLRQYYRDRAGAKPAEEALAASGVTR
ncbi:MAG: UDP-N-acetylglucosamine 2-epimerase (non-hydrolyzing) [Verrucomicrobiota bacterium JB022]|nr:UDP-N-acetylglucosamine 2-epimerase (non-hydrolyzing) [Verrucomicrobiota bacterium JB022]